MIKPYKYPDDKGMTDETSNTFYRVSHTELGERPKRILAIEKDQTTLITKCLCNQIVSWRNSSLGSINTHMMHRLFYVLIRISPISWQQIFDWEVI